MPQLVTIKPKAGSRRFAVRGNITQYNKVDGNIGTNEVRSSGEYKGERFPNSRQFIKVKWSESKRKWLLAGARDNSDALNELVKACNLKYEEDHRRVGDYIEKADIYDRDDPFFTHSKLKMVAREGEFVLDKDYPKDKILIMAIQAQHEFEVNGVNSNASTRVKYVITDKNIDKKAKQMNRKRELEAIELYQGLDDSKKLKVAIAMGFVSNDRADLEMVDEMLYDAAKNPKQQEYFIAMCKASTTEIHVRYLIHKARGSGYLKKVKDQGWVLFGQPVGKTDGQVYAYFKNPDNQDILLRLENMFDTDDTVNTMPLPKGVDDSILDSTPDTEIEVEEKVVKKKTRSRKDDSK